MNSDVKAYWVCAWWNRILNPSKLIFWFVELPLTFTVSFKGVKCQATVWRTGGGCFVLFLVLLFAGCRAGPKGVGAKTRVDDKASKKLGLPQLWGGCKWTVRRDWSPAVPESTATSGSTSTAAWVLLPAEPKEEGRGLDGCRACVALRVVAPEPRAVIWNRHWKILLFLVNYDVINPWLYEPISYTLISYI